MSHIFHISSFTGVEVRLSLRLFSLQISSLATPHINIHKDVPFTLKEKG